MSKDATLWGRADEAIILTFIIILITLLHYSTTSSGNVLLHEISQRFYYIPIIYAAYRFGLKGSIFFSILSGVIYLLHISEHRTAGQTTILNQYAEVIMFQLVGITTGFFADAEKQQRQSFEKASGDLSKAYQELKNTVDLLVRTARLKSLGELAAAITHEIRNPLASIKGAVEIVSEEIALESPRREFITVIEKEVDRLNKLVEEFLRFARPRTPEKLPVNLNELVIGIVKFVSPQAAKAGVTLVAKPNTEVPLVPIDAEQIQQVLLNLILNAIQAMPTGGLVEITCEAVLEQVEICVRDHGTGITQEQRSKVFEPFFTTKAGGSGLGLAIAYQLVKQHSGELKLAEIEPPGSLFVISLPLNNPVSTSHLPQEST